MKNNHKGGGIKMLLLRHCEKGGAGLLALVAAYLVYASLGVQGESRRPQELRDKVNLTNGAYKKAVVGKLGEEDFLKAYDPSNVDMVEITSDKYAGSRTGWDPAVVKPMIDRTDPTLLAAMDLEGTAVTGLMAFVDESIRAERVLEELRQQQEMEKERERERERDNVNSLLDGRGGVGGARGINEGNGKRRPIPSRIREPGVTPQGDERIQTVSCAVVLAKAPSLAQFNLYKEALENARGYNPSQDAPNYLGYYVERTDVPGGKEPQWTAVGIGSITGGRRSSRLTAVSLRRMIADWIPGQEPMVDSRYEHPSLTVPLPPLVGQAWGPEVVHSEAPFQAETDAAKLKEEAQKNAPDANGDGDGNNDDDSDLFARNDASSRRGPGDGTDGRRMSGRKPGMGMRGGPGMDGGGMRGRRSSTQGAGVFSPEIPFVMVRFFDFSVLPGRQYRYRIRLILKDVNQEPGVDPRALAREVTQRIHKQEEKSTIRLAEWSQASPVISVPMAGGISVAGAKVPSSKQPNAEGSVELLVQSYALDENQKAIKAGLVKFFKRGAVMNMTEDAEIITPDRRWIEEVDSFKFHTGVTLCDFSGGESIPGKLKSPVHVLLMDATGRLFVRRQLDDSQTVEDHKLIFDEKRNKQRGRGGDLGIGIEGGRR